MRHALTSLLLLAFLLFGSSLPRAEEPQLSKIEPLTVATDSGATLFTVEIADTEALRERGLMFRQRLPEDRGMLFDFGRPRPVAMWMKNTYIALDMVFIRADGSVAYVKENTVPGSLEVIGVQEPVLGVLELAAGTARRIGLRAGDLVYHRIFATPE
ncbi:MAG: DUF192 domain-containing protein [Rhizobiales bacterium]|nr:DUF192 domain-containing protein [Hyphomicrobiales bacterium]MBI3672985.1 DUF192 domain-containing protein [Hyphomicrobiales bacterium]